MMEVKVKKLADLNHVMCVDDSDLDIFLLKHFLKLKGFHGELEVFQTAKEFTSRLQAVQHFPDLIFIDLNMHNESGYELAKDIYNSALVGLDRSSVILCSSDARIDKELMKKEGISFLLKPIHESWLKELGWD